MKYFFNCFLSIVLLFLSAGAYSQVVVTSSDSLSCFVPSTTLSATFTGDNPVDAGIKIDDQYPDIPNPIGFTFNFYGTNYTKCLIGPNGTICFDTTLAG